MADYGMTPKGFIPKRLAQIQDDMNTQLAQIQDIKTGEYPFQNITDDSILQQIVGVFAGQLEEAWNAAYQGSIQFDPLKNTGVGQSATVQLNAITRKPGSRARVVLLLRGEPNTIIPAGSRIASIDTIHFVTTNEDARIADDGSVKVEATAGVKEPWAPEADEIVVIQSPLAGWKSVTNIETLSVGTYEESDEALRMRQQQSTSLTSYRLIDSIYSAVKQVPGVIYAHVYQNSSFDPMDYREIPFKEVAVVVEGGDEKEVAEAIYLRLPTGQTGYGNTMVPFFDNQGISNPIYFSRPVKKSIFVDIGLTITNESVFPSDYEEQIINAIIQYAQYGGEGNSDGFPPGTNIIRTRLFTPINTVPGHRVDRLRIGLSRKKVASSDIVLGWREVGQFLAQNIDITVSYA